MSHILRGVDLYSLCIPYPPSVNHYWGRSVKGARFFVPPKVKLFREKVAREVLQARQDSTLPMGTLTEELDLSLVVYPPDRRVRDLDNILKGTLDALTVAGVWKDDKQVSRLLIERASSIDRAGGHIKIAISERRNDNGRD